MGWLLGKLDCCAFCTTQELVAFALYFLSHHVQPGRGRTGIFPYHEHHLPLEFVSERTGQDSKCLSLTFPDRSQTMEERNEGGREGEMKSKRKGAGEGGRRKGIQVRKKEGRKAKIRGRH